MSHSVTITRTTTTSGNSSALILNTGYYKTIPGLLKLLQFILGIAAIVIMAFVSHPTSNYWTTPQLFFLLMATTFLIGTFCLLLSCLISFSTGGIISKTIYELIYHSIAFILYLVASGILLWDLNHYNYPSKQKNWEMTAAVIGIVLSILYLVSAIYARKSYRGI